MKNLHLSDRDYDLVLMALASLKKESVMLKAQIAKGNKPESILLEHYTNVFNDTEKLIKKIQS